MPQGLYPTRIQAEVSGSPIRRSQSADVTTCVRKSMAQCADVMPQRTETSAAARENPNGGDSSKGPQDSAPHTLPQALWEELWWRKPLVEVPQLLTWTSSQQQQDSDSGAAGGSGIILGSSRRLLLEERGDRDLVRGYVKWLSKQLKNKILGKPTGPWAPYTPDLDSIYTVSNELGRGRYGKVRLCEETATGRKFACKTILKSGVTTVTGVGELCAEILIPLRLQEGALGTGKGSVHTRERGLVHLHEVVDDDVAVHLIMDYCDGGDLFDHIVMFGRLSEKHAAQVVKEVALALIFMHKQGVVHRDLKPENVLLERPHEGDSTDTIDGENPACPAHSSDSSSGAGGAPPGVKIADFGLCKELEAGEKTVGALGSLYYVAPEVFLRQPYDHSVDVWSLGVVLYTCLSGRLPFCGKDEASTYAEIVRARPSFRKKPWCRVSYEAKALVQQMLHPHPEKRISLQELLSHEWIIKHCYPYSLPSTKQLRGLRYAVKRYRSNAALL